MKRLFMCLLPLLMGSPAMAQEAPEALVRSLYGQVVTRHPLGVPSGEDTAVLAPYLSTTLLKRFDLRIACDADWRRQNPAPDLKPPGLFEDGLFSGGSEQALPTDFSVGRTEVTKDGTVRVHVKLTWEDEWNPPMIWYVAAVVVHENGRPVVEDVLFLKDDDQTIDLQLSAWLTVGCDGPRWAERPGWE